MQVEKLNQELLSLPESHIAHRFLRAFIECRRHCIGREASNDPVDHEWFSECDGRLWSYSEFSYTFLSFDIVLDGWLTRAPTRTRNEEQWIAQLPRWRELLRECKSAAELDNNAAVLPIIAQVLGMFELWEECIVKRDTATENDYPPRANRDLYPKSQ